MSDNYSNQTTFPSKINCFKKVDCVMNGFCVAESLLYYAAISCKKICQTFLRNLQNNFQKSYANHELNAQTFTN